MTLKKCKKNMMQNMQTMEVFSKEIIAKYIKTKKQNM